MEGAQDLDLVPEDDLVVVPRSSGSSSKGPANRRAFQKRRRSRACDACRLRKTKCDAPPDGTCTSCASASLLCKFSEHDNEKKKVGPARRLRMLEATVQDLNEKLRIAEAKLQSSQLSNNERSDGSLDIDQSTSDSFSTVSFPRRNSGTPYSAEDSLSSSKSFTHSPDIQSPRPSLAPGVVQRRFSYESSGNDDLFIGSTSGLGFLASVQEYVEKLGYDTTSLAGAWKHSEVQTYPLNSSLKVDGLQPVDLRGLLPPKNIGRKLLDIFHQHTTRCLPVFYWPVILDKFDRAYGNPIYANDQVAVTSIFCVIMSINAYSSVCSDDEDIYEKPQYNHKRGWHFFEDVKKYHDLHRPIYSLADAEVLLVTALYLDLVALPSPSWMAVGSLARVCQDLGLHRQAAEGKFSSSELEHRSRIFWSTFYLDRKLALQSGRPSLLSEAEIDVDEPGNHDIVDLVDRTFEATPSGLNNLSSVTLMKQLVALTRHIDPILRLSVSPGAEQQFEIKMHDIEQKLDLIERGFPEGILDWSISTPLDPVLLKYVIITMAARLTMYRFFTDLNLDRGLRTRCFIRSVEVAKGTAHLLRRAMKYQTWEQGFRLYQTDLSYQHTFKISIILLLASTIFTRPFQEQARTDLETCVSAMQTAAPSRPTVAQSLHLFNEISMILTRRKNLINATNLAPSPVSTLNAPSNYGSSRSSSSSNPIFSAAGSSPAQGIVQPGLSQTTTPSSVITPNRLPQGSLALQIPPVVPSNDIQSADGGIIPKFWPNYDPSGRITLGFSDLSTPSPNENTQWLNYVDPSYWTLMENVLSNETTMTEARPN